MADRRNGVKHRDYQNLQDLTVNAIALVPTVSTSTRRGNLRRV